MLSNNSKANDILIELGIADANELDHNPIFVGLQELVDGSTHPLAEQYAKIIEPHIWGATPNKSALATAFVLAQTAVLNECGGPALDPEELVTIRNRWYFAQNEHAKGFKYFSQLLETYVTRTADVVFCGSALDFKEAKDLGAKMCQDKKAREIILEKLEIELGRPVKYHIWPKDGLGRVYPQLLSTVLVNLVNSGMYTYASLWIEDVSRKIEVAKPLVENAYIVLALEKESLLKQFKKFCERAGIAIALAMKGNSSFASIEAILERYFKSEHGYLPSPENPLHILVLSDFDYYGLVPVQAALIEQFAHYLGHESIVLHRVGITPQQVEEITGNPAIEHAYVFKHDKNRTTQKWAEDYAIWDDSGKAWAIEIEALPSRAFIPYIVDAVIEACGGDEELRKKLLELAEVDWDDVTGRIASKIKYATEIGALVDDLVELAIDIRAKTDAIMTGAATDLLGNEDDPGAWRNSEQAKEAIKLAMDRVASTISAEDFANHLMHGSGAWRPSSDWGTNRTAANTYALTHRAKLDATSTQIDNELEEMKRRLSEAQRIMQDFA